MKVLLVFLFVILVALPDTDGWRWRRRRRWIRRRWIRRTWRKYGPLIRAGLRLAGREVDATKQLDSNGDGFIDHSEASDMLEERDAKDFLELADEDGDSKVTLDEFARYARQVNTMDE